MTDRRRQQAVVEAMRHAWGSYVQYAWGHDELDPVGKLGKDDFGGVGATIVDCLDTLWLMGLKKEFEAARDWTANNLSFSTSAVLDDEEVALAASLQLPIRAARGHV